MNGNAKLLPLAKIDGKDFLVDVVNREFRDFDNQGTVIKMHSPIGRQILRELQGTDWNSMGISTGRQKDLVVQKMAEDETCAAEKVISQLLKDGWKMQKGGISYINGTLGTNLFKDGEVLTVQQEFMPDEEFIEQEWPEVQQ